MRGTLIGSDYLKQGNEVKFLELNTNVSIHKDVDWLDLNPLMAVLTSSGVTDFHFIYIDEEKAQFPLELDGEYNFAKQISSSCANHNINYHPHEIALGGLTVPYIEDADDKFILRQAYDNTAVIDSSYAADNFEFFNLMSGSGYEPKTYISSSSDDIYFNSLDALQTGSNHPNVLIKGRFPSSAGDLSVYKFTDTSSISSDLQNLKDNLDEDFLIQEFINDNSNITSGSWSVIRALDILYGDNLDVLNLGGYKITSYLELDDFDITYSGSSQKLDTKSLVLYNNKKYNTQNNFFHTDAETLVLKTDGSLISGSDLVVGDQIKTIAIDFEYGMYRNGSDTSGSVETPNHYGYINDITGSIGYYTSSLMGVNSEPEDIPMVVITLNDNSTFTDSPEQPFLIEESGSTLTYFEYANKFVVGDKICYLDINTNQITTKEITGINLTWGDPSIDIYNFNFEPSDYFLSHVSGSQYKILHNACNGCGSWAPCGDNWCDSGCPGCGGAPEFK